jgi:hypothetical protein
MSSTTSPSSTAGIAARNARLDALNSATQAWVSQRQADINARVATSEAILKGRTGAERLAQAAVDATSNLVVTSISQFLSS